MLLGLVENDDTPVSTPLDMDTGVGFVSDSSDMAIVGEKQQCFPQIPTPTNRKNPKIMFVNMVFLLDQGKNFALVNIIDANSFKDLGFNEMANTSLGDDGDSNGLLNFFDELWVTHSSHVTLGSDIGGDSFKSHDGTGSGFFSDASLFGGEEVFFCFINEKEKENERL